MIREATSLDRISVLKFCKDTFSWGDYVSQVWDFWLSEGNLLLFEERSPVGICHVFSSKDQIWIEGIRVDKNFRRKKVASNLVSHAELIGRENYALYSYMLIETQNSSSLSMANSLNYDIYQTWKFYSLLPKQNSNYSSISFDASLRPEDNLYFVKSWRWIPIDKNTFSILSKQKNIIESKINHKKSIAILSDSEHFEKTLIVTLFAESTDTAFCILSFLQNYGMKKNYRRIQILTKENLPRFDSLDHKISFHLMKKPLT